MGAIALFVLPSGDRQQPQLLVWEDVSQLPWGVLVLFGGGLSLASAIASSGLAQWLGEGLAPLALFWRRCNDLGRHRTGDLFNRNDQ